MFPEQSTRKGSIRVRIARFVLIFMIAVPQQSMADSTPIYTQLDVLKRLIYLLKAGADEAFIGGDRQRAQEKYEEASSFLRSVSADLPSKAVRDDFAMLAQDVGYRQRQLELGRSFWQPLAGSLPGNPILLETRLHTWIAKLSEAIDRVQADLGRSQSETITQDQLLAEITKARLEAQKAQNDLSKHTFVIDSARDAKAATNELLKANAARQREIQNTIAQRDQEYKQSEATANSALMSIVASASGVDPTVVKSLTTAKGQNLGQVLAGAALTYAGSDSGKELIASSESLSKSVGALVETYNKGKDAVDNLQKLQDDAQLVSNALHKGTIESLMQAGSVIYADLPPDGQDALKKYLVDLKPAPALIDMLSKDGWREQVFDALDQELGLDEKVGALVLPAITKGRDSYLGYLKAAEEAALAASSTVADKRLALDLLVRGKAIVLVNALPQEAITAIETQLKVKTARDVATLIADRGLDAIPESKIVENDFIVGEAKVSLSTLLRLPALEQLDLSDAEAKAAADKIVGDIKGKGKSAVLSALSALPIADRRREVLELFKKSDSREVFDRIVVGPKAVPGLLDKLAGFTAASIVLPDAYSKGDLLPSGSDILTSLDPSLKNGSDGDTGIDAMPGNESAANQAAQQQMATAALAAICPECSVALAATKMAGAMLTQQAISDSISRLSRESAELLKQQVVLGKALKDANLTQSLAEADSVDDQLRISAGASLTSIYFDAFKTTTDIKSTLILRAKLTLPLIYYEAEQARQIYAQLNESLAFWNGADKGNDRPIERATLDDPDKLRLALDPEIALYSWFSGATSGSRGDLLELQARWNRIDAIVEDVCGSSLKCKPGAGFIDRVKSTNTLHLSTLVGKNIWSNFLAWKSSPFRPRAFSFTILVAPDTPALGIQRDLQAIRLLGVSAGIETKGKIQSSNSLAIAHPGLSYVPFGSGYQVMVSKPAIQSNVAWKNPSPGDLARYASTWDTGHLPDDFDGYGLFTVWKIIVDPGADLTGLDDIVFRMDYRYREAPVAVGANERALLAALAAQQIIVCGSQRHIAGAGTMPLITTDPNWESEIGSLEVLKNGFDGGCHVEASSN